MKSGLIQENGELIYYEDGFPRHAGAIKVDGDIYYISSGGKAVKGLHIVHGEMTNGILERGTYTFGEDYKLVPGSFIPPKSHARRKVPRKKLKKRILIASCVLLVTLLICLGWAHASGLTLPLHSNPAGTEAQGISLPSFTEDVLLCSRPAQYLYDHRLSVGEAVAYGNPYVPFQYAYDIGVNTGNLLLSEHSDLSDAREFPLESGRHWLSIDNLKTGTIYYYQATVGQEIHTGTFRTAPSTRFVNLPGVRNARDIGGYVTLDGKTVRQGLLIRGAEIDELVEPGYLLDADSLDEVQEVFGFVYDFDLRSSTISSGRYQSPLGSAVRHKFYDSPQYDGIFRESLLPIMKNIFTDLADPGKYPMYLHCTHGADRTGTIIFLLQGVLNMSREDMIREYRLTGYAFPGYAESDDMQKVIDSLQSYPGGSLQEQIVYYLTEVVGITDSQIESIRDIFLEG